MCIDSFSPPMQSALFFLALAMPYAYVGPELIEPGKDRQYGKPGKKPVALACALAKKDAKNHRARQLFAKFL
jgi:hypothetical protein